MLRKRLIFTLLFDNGNFMLSRNFRLQKVGDIGWLKKNYDFSNISFFIDELIILDVTRKKTDSKLFLNALESITDGCFVPIAAGGGIRSYEYANSLFNSGADKIVLNSSIFDNPDLIQKLSINFGQQAIVASLDLKKDLNSNYQIYTNSGLTLINNNLEVVLKNINSSSFGECYLNSINQDGTGQGFDINMLDYLPKDWNIPIILAGGAGNPLHLITGLKDSRVDAVATANLLNFVGDGLAFARNSIISGGIDLATWPSVNYLNKYVN